MNCLVCNVALEGRKRSFCGVKHRRLHFNRIHQAKLKEKGLQAKRDLVQQAGGQCSRCGYSRNLAALAFHHARGVKLFELNQDELSRRTTLDIDAEFDKCVLLCSNCHVETHYPLLNSF